MSSKRSSVVLSFFEIIISTGFLPAYEEPLFPSWLLRPSLPCCKTEPRKSTEEKFHRCYLNSIPKVKVPQWFKKIASFLLQILKVCLLTTICVHPWSVTNFTRSFTFQTLTVCPVMCQFWPMKRWRLCRELTPSIPACFVYVLSELSGFSWKRSGFAWPP